MEPDFEAARQRASLRLLEALERIAAAQEARLAASEARISELSAELAAMRREQADNAERFRQMMSVRP